MTQIKTEAATIRWRSNGAWSCPMVLRVPIGGYLTGGVDLAQPVRRVDLRPRPRADRRLPVAGPRRRRHAAGRVPLRRPGAVPRAQAPAAPALHARPVPAAGVGRARSARATCGEPAPASRSSRGGPRCRSRSQAVDQLGADIEVIDLRWIVPWDQELVAESVDRTGRCLVVHEDVRTGGFGGEVASWVAETCFSSLDAPCRASGQGLPRRLRAEPRGRHPPAGRRHRRQGQGAAGLLTASG